MSVSWTVNGITRSSGSELTVKASKGMRVAVSFKRDIFSSEKFSVPVPEISRMEDVYTYDLPVAVPKTHPDTAKLVLAIRPKVRDNDFTWHWFYRNKKTGKDESAGSGNMLALSPPNLIPFNNLRAELHYEGRVVATEMFPVEVEEILGPPMNFQLGTKGDVYEGDPGILHITSKEVKNWPPPNVQWIWRVGTKVDTTSIPEYRLNKIERGTTVRVHAYLNRKKSLEQIISLRDLVKVHSSLPERVIGDTSVCLGERTTITYEFHGAELGTENSAWLLDFDGKILRSPKPSFSVSVPRKQGRFTARMYPDREPNKYFAFSLSVYAPPQVPDQIYLVSGGGELCPGKDIALSATPRRTSGETIWDWYIDQTGGAPQFLYTGDTLRTKIAGSTTYLVKSRTAQCTSNLIRSIALRTVVFSYAPAITINTPSDKNKRYRSFEVVTPAPYGTRYEWILNGDKLDQETGPKTGSYAMKRGQNTITLRVKNECQQENHSSQPIDIPKPTSFTMVSLGAVSNRADVFPNLMATVGSRSFYFRGKFNPITMLSANDYKTGFRGVPLEVNDKSQITNYPPGTGTYYSVGAGIKTSHVGFTAGGMLPLTKSKNTSDGPLPISVAFGAGYGKRDVYWSTQVQSYADQSSSTYWAKNIDQSWKGLEVEGGVFISVSRKVFLMPGFSFIFDSNKQVPYKSVSFAVGLAFENGK
ncbi:MAG: hypothetical protein ACKO6Q_02175 [Bacteroidota bacterium]